MKIKFLYQSFSHIGWINLERNSRESFFEHIAYFEVTNNTAFPIKILNIINYLEQIDFDESHFLL